MRHPAGPFPSSFHKGKNNAEQSQWLCWLILYRQGPRSSLSLLLINTILISHLSHRFFLRRANRLNFPTVHWFELTVRYMHARSSFTTSSKKQQNEKNEKMINQKQSTFNYWRDILFGINNKIIIILNGVENYEHTMLFMIDFFVACCAYSYSLTFPSWLSTGQSTRVWYLLVYRISPLHHQNSYYQF